MNGNEFWRRWRYDIIRGALIFSMVVGVGLAVRSMVGRGRAQLSDLRRTFDVNLDAPGRQQAPPWTYNATLPAKATLWLRDINGSITVEPADGKTVEITAERSFRHSPADSVRLLTSVTTKGLTVCAVWPAESVSCGPDGRYTTGGMQHGNDVAVSFTVRLPSGVELDASTVNGDVKVGGVSAPVAVGTVNGDVSIETTGGPVRANTVNGDVNAVIRGFAGPGDVKVTTVRGDATLELPPDLNAVVDGHTVAGDISTDFPVTVTGKFASHTIAGTIGSGGRQIHVSTVTGDVQLQKLGSAPAAVPAVQVTPAPPTPPARPQAKTRPTRAP
jgi:hypothetical protein